MSRKVEIVAEPLISPRKLTARAVGELDVKEYEMEKLSRQPKCESLEEKIISKYTRNFVNFIWDRKSILSTERISGHSYGYDWGRRTLIVNTCLFK